MIHQNTMEAFETECPRFSQREQAILDSLGNKHMTDRALARWMGFGSDLNMVRPRITHLIELGALEQIGDTKCPTTGKTVRVVGRKQMELFT